MVVMVRRGKWTEVTKATNNFVLTNIFQLYTLVLAKHGLNA